MAGGSSAAAGSSSRGGKRAAPAGEPPAAGGKKKRKAATQREKAALPATPPLKLNAAEKAAEAWRAAQAAGPFPPTISYRRSGSPAGVEGEGPLALAPAPSAWVGKAAATNAAQRVAPAADVCRLAGTKVFAFRYKKPRGGGSLRAFFYEGPDAICRASLNSKRATQWKGHYEWFHAETGEPSGAKGLAAVGRLAEAVNAGELVCRGAHDFGLLWALWGLTAPDRGVWKCPLARVVIPGPDPEALAAAERSGGSPWFEVHASVYLLRLAFELISCDDLKAVLAHLDPVAAVEPPRPPLATTAPATFAKSAAARQADPFTLTGLLAAQESTGYRDLGPGELPAGLGLELLPFQRQTLAWMMDMEALPGGINSLFWERRVWADNLHLPQSKLKRGKPPEEPEHFWAFPMAGELRLDEPPLRWGGLLAEEMGLGKTVELAALILDDKRRGYPGYQEELAELAAGDEEVLATTTGTLIIAPATLISQWAKEIEKACPGLSFHLHLPERATAAQRKRDKEKAAREGTKADRFARAACERTATELAKVDIVLTTYTCLEGERAGKKLPKVLSRMGWRRIILDECQYIRSSTTQLAQMCEKLHGRRRWIVSGTPLFDSVDDLNGELNFLGVWPFSLPDSTDGFWELKCKPWRRHTSAPAAARESLDLIQQLLARVMIRHTKAQRAVGGGPNLLNLPDLRQRALAVKLSETERYAYLTMEVLARMVCCREDRIVGSVLTVESCMRLLRNMLTSTEPWRTGQVKKNDFLSRADTLFRQLLLGGADGGDLLNFSAAGLRTLPAKEALRELMRPKEVREEGPYVRHANAYTNNYASGRARALPSLKDQLQEAEARQQDIEQKIASAKKRLARERWAAAIEAVTSGCILLPGRAPFTPSSFIFVFRAAVRSQLAREAEEAEEENPAEPVRASEPPRAASPAPSEDEPLDDAEEAEEQEDPEREGERSKALLAGVVAVQNRQDRLARASRLFDMQTSKMDELQRPLTGHKTSTLEAKFAEFSARVVEERNRTGKKPKKPWPTAAEKKVLAKELQVGSDAVGEWFKARKLWGLRQKSHQNAKRAPDESLYAKLRAAAAAKAVQIDELTGQLASMLPYTSLLKKAATALGEDAKLTATLEQTGFQSLNDLMEGRAENVICSICHGPVRSPVVTRCAHINCASCLLKWLAAAPLMQGRSAAAGAMESAPCPICRKEFTRGQLIQIKEPEPEGGPEGPATGEAEEENDDRQAPALIAAATEARLKALRLPAEIPGAGRDPRYPSLTASLLSAFAAMTGGGSHGVLPSKLDALADILEDNFGRGRKVIVFSQHKAAIDALDGALGPRFAGTHFSKLTVGMTQASRLQALGQFANDPECRCFLLHASVAASGLTLTMASTVVLFEPFASESDEKQAISRCHRMGQTAEVEVVRLYSHGTVEERLLAIRAADPASDRKAGSFQHMLAVLGLHDLELPLEGPGGDDGSPSEEDEEDEEEDEEDDEADDEEESM